MHANKNDKDLGQAITVDYLVELFKLAKCDLIQTDTKGHEGLVSWYSITTAASVAPGISQEMVDIWVKAGKKLGIPCQAYYSGIYEFIKSSKQSIPYFYFPKQLQVWYARPLVLLNTLPTLFAGNFRTAN